MKSDLQLRRDLKAELKSEPGVNAAGICVAVVNGVVTLSGFVKTYPEKWAAARAVRRVRDVKAIFGEIEVRPPQENKRTDTKIWEQTEGSTVILRGKAGTLLEREEAEERAWAEPGVTAVDDQITVTD